MNGYNLSPGFRDPTGGDYHLTTNSDMVDAGLIIPGINDSFLGIAPDLGAFEFDPGHAVQFLPFIVR
jgi:hypothetical protein